jgi:dTMP kinase
MWLRYPLKRVVKSFLKGGLKPLFITLEGGEGVGKTTVAQILKSFFEAKGLTVLLTREPGGCHLSEEVRELLLRKRTKIFPKAELLLFLAARAQHIEEEILPALKKGCVVICDRFHDSSIAYQGFGRDLGEDEVKTLCEKGCGSLRPDLTLLLDAPVEIGLKRASQRGELDDRIGEEIKTFHEKVREGFLTLAKKEPNRMVVIDATLPLKEVIEKIEHVLCKL